MPCPWIIFLGEIGIDGSHEVLDPSSGLLAIRIVSPMSREIFISSERKIFVPAFAGRNNPSDSFVSFRASRNTSSVQRFSARNTHLFCNDLYRQEAADTSGNLNFGLAASVKSSRGFLERRCRAISHRGELTWLGGWRLWGWQPREEDSINEKLGASLWDSLYFRFSVLATCHLSEDESSIF